jgi:hypothetical protein
VSALRIPPGSVSVRTSSGGPRIRKTCASVIPFRIAASARQTRGALESLPQLPAPRQHRSQTTSPGSARPRPSLSDAFSPWTLPGLGGSRYRLGVRLGSLAIRTPAGRILAWPRDPRAGRDGPPLSQRARR